jgi:hypothetical protein
LIFAILQTFAVVESLLNSALVEGYIHTFTTTKKSNPSAQHDDSLLSTDSIVLEENDDVASSVPLHELSCDIEELMNGIELCKFYEQQIGKHHCIIMKSFYSWRTFP